MLMGKIKIHEIAKELNITSKEVLEKAKELGIEAKSHLSGVEETEAQKIRDSFSTGTKKIAEEKKEKQQPANHVIIRREIVVSDE